MPAMLERPHPWDGVGTALKRKMTAADAIKAGGLDWEVAVEPALRRTHSGKVLEVPGQFWIAKQDDEQILGKVTERYVPFQNRDAFTFADNLVDSGEGKYTKVGPLRHNKVIFLVMEIPREIVVAGTDAHELHLIFMTSHDGSKAISAYVSLTRIDCTNQLTTAQRNAPHTWSIPHVADVKMKVQQARESLQLTFAKTDAFVELGTVMARTPITQDKFHQILKDSLPHRPRTSTVIEEIESLYTSSPTNGHQGTAWGAFNAVTEYFDHQRDTKSGEAVFFGAINGEPAKARNAVASRLLAMT